MSEAAIGPKLTGIGIEGLAAILYVVPTAGVPQVIAFATVERDCGH